MFLTPMGRFDEAISELKKAQELDPLSLIINAMGGYVYSFSGQPDKAIESCHMVRYYGLYANAHRGKVRKAGDDPSHPPVIAEETPFVPARGWAELIRKVYEVDPLLCPSCGGQMSIIAFIEDHKVIDKIIDHLKLTFMAERPPPQRLQQELLMAVEERGDYF